VLFVASCIVEGFVFGRASHLYRDLVIGAAVAGLIAILAEVRDRRRDQQRHLLLPGLSESARGRASFWVWIAICLSLNWMNPGLSRFL
jgi:hypothetical protein